MPFITGKRLGPYKILSFGTGEMAVLSCAAHGNPNGRGLFYRSGDKMMVVDLTTQSGFAAGTPRVLFSVRLHPGLGRGF